MGKGNVGKSIGRIRSKQVGDLPDYPVQNLYPCHLTEGVDWYVHPVHLLSVGIMVALEGSVTYAPAMVHRMNIKSFRVWVQFDTFAEGTRFRMALRYYDKDEQAHQQTGVEVGGSDEKFCFDVPLDHIDKRGWFACSLFVELLTPMEGEAKDRAEAVGRDQPHEPVLIRGCWLEVNG